MGSIVTKPGEKKYHPHTPAKVMKVAKREQIQLEKKRRKNVIRQPDKKRKKNCGNSQPQ